MKVRRSQPLQWIGSLLGAGLATMSLLGAVPPPDPAAVQEVVSGKRTEARAVWWGFDTNDTTAALQAAIHSGARRVVVEDVGLPWIVRPIQLASDQEILFEPAVVVLAKRGAFHGKSDCLFTASLKTNITLVGYSATFRMWRQDYASSNYSKAEWRHCLNLRSSSNVRVYGLTLTESGGDGIYLGVARPDIPNQDVHIKDVVCDGNYRQGISVISAENLLMEHCTLKNTGGTAPMAGIDFEPNYSRERLVHCVLRDCVTENNAGDGFLFALHNLDGTSAPVSIRLERCRSLGDRRSGLRWHARNSGAAGPTRATADFVDCTFQDAGQPGIYISDTAASSSRFRFVNCQILNTATNLPEVAPITFQSGPMSENDIGGVVFADCVVRDTLDRAPMTHLDWLGNCRLVDVRGTLTVDHNGQTRKYTLDPETLAAWMPWTAFKKLPRFDMANVRFEPVFPDRPADLPRFSLWRQRDQATFLIWLRAGEDTDFSIQVHAVGSGPKRAPVRLVSPEGKQILSQEAEETPGTSFRFTAEETGAYRISCEPGSSTVSILAPRHRVCASAEQRLLHFFGARGEFFFWVPAGVREFGVKVIGGNLGERVKASLHNPKGQRVEEKDSIARPHLFVVTRSEPSAGEVWSIRFDRPSEGVLEDYFVDLLGVPPLLARSPEALLQPVE